MSLHSGTPADDAVSDRLRALAARLDSIARSATTPAAGAPQMELLAALMEEVVVSAEQDQSSTMPEVERQRAINNVADAYGADADRNQILTTRLYTVLIGLALGAAATVVVGLVDFPTKKGGWPPLFSAQLSLAGVLLVAIVPIWVQAERHRRAASESRRLERQLRMVDPYLQPLPERTQAVMRAALTPRLFSRLLEDQDPMREPAWPSSGSLFE